MLENGLASPPGETPRWPGDEPRGRVSEEERRLLDASARGPDPRYRGNIRPSSAVPNMQTHQSHR